MPLFYVKEPFTIDTLLHECVYFGSRVSPPLTEMEMFPNLLQFRNWKITETVHIELTLGTHLSCIHYFS